MKKILIALALSLLASAGFAKDLFKVQTQVGWAYFTDQVGECLNGGKEGRLEYSVGKKVLKLCWRPTPRGVYVEDADGDTGTIPFEMLEEVKSV